MIKITDEYYLDKDSIQFIVKEKYVNKKGEEKFKDIAFCGNLKDVKNFLYTKEIRKDLTILENVELCIQLSNRIDRGLVGMK